MEADRGTFGSIRCQKSRCIVSDKNKHINSTPARWLVLVPTELELTHLRRSVEFSSLLQHECQLGICGFGPIVAAARTSQLIADKRPSRILLVGIAGNYNDNHPIGSACSFDRVSCFGIGIGSGDQYQSATAAGWPQWSADDPDETIKDSISLPNSATKGTLLTCTTSSSGPEDVARRLAEFPNAVAEDMEGFSVAAACRLAGLPLTIVRGISNRAGDRNKSNWKIEQALGSAAEQVVDIVRGMDAASK